VGSKPGGASPYGALDMAGNVWEWVADWYGESYYASSPAINPQGPASGDYRVLRGGAWSNSPYYVRAAVRYRNSPDDRFDYLGFRVAASAKPSTETNTSGGNISGEEMTIRLADGVDMILVRVPAGEFLMGSADNDTAAASDEKRQHTVTLDEYWIGKYEVTNAQYAAFAAAKNIDWSMPSGKENHPVVSVSWYDAVAFCEWLSEVSGRTIRLPTEAEWEKAARGTDGRLYPWGNESPTCDLAQYGECDGGALPVGSKPKGASPYGALDMAGNVWEWVADWSDSNYYDNSPNRNPTGPTSGEYRGLRGGAWFDISVNVRAAYRGGHDPDLRNVNFGFRVAASAPVP
jgi:formylglycine-generating enzyme required for sulfatase activity